MSGRQGGRRTVGTHPDEPHPGSWQGGGLSNET